MPQQDTQEPPMDQEPEPPMDQEPELPMDQDQQMNDMGGTPGDDQGGDMAPDDMGEMPEDGQEPMNGDDDSTMGIINQLSDTDKKAVRAYAESMLDRDESQNSNNEMYENFIFTKGQLDKIHEVLLTTDDEQNEPINKTNKKIKKGNTKSPFDSPFA